MSDCQRGCLLYGQHIPNCTCHHECPEHEGHCEGCLPKPSDVGHYCQRCADRLRNTLNAIPDLALTVSCMPGGQLVHPVNTADPTRRATKVDQHSPSPAHDAYDEATRWATSWAFAIADERAERGPFRYRRDGIPKPICESSIRYLVARLEHICAADYANDLNDEANQLRHRLTIGTGSDEADQRIPAPCPRCNHRTLIRPNGTEHVECRNPDCAAVWYADEYQALGRIIAS